MDETENDSSPIAIEKEKLSKRCKRGEIYENPDGTYSIACRYCHKEFPYFYEFKLHIEEPCIRKGIEDLTADYDDVDIVELNASASVDQHVIKVGQKLTLINKAVKYMTRWNDDDSKTLIDGMDYEKVGTKYKCLRCGRIICKKRELQNHIDAKHTKKEKKFECPICSRKFLHLEYVQRHLQNAHKVKYTANMVRMAQKFDDNAVNGAKQSLLRMNLMKSQIKSLNGENGRLKKQLEELKQQTGADDDNNYSAVESDNANALTTDNFSFELMDEELDGSENVSTNGVDDDIDIFDDDSLQVKTEADSDGGDESVMPIFEVNIPLK